MHNMLLAPKKVEFFEANTCFFSVVCFKRAKILHILEFFQARRLKKNFKKKSMILAIIAINFQFVAHYGGVHGALRISLKSFIKAEVEF